MNPDSVPPQTNTPTPATFKPARDKTTALIMAIFLSIFAWLYTYERDKKKFWASLAAYIVLLVVPIASNGLALVALYYLCTLAIYIWVIVDTIRKPDAYFIHYPHYQAHEPGSALPGQLQQPAMVQPQQSTVAQPSDDDAYQVLMPTKNKFSLKSYYYGCIGILPLIGLPFSVLAITNGRKALQQYKLNPTPGAKIHAKIGIGLAALELMCFVFFLFVFIDFLVR